MAQSVSLWGASYTDVPAIDVPKTGGGTARFTDTSPTTAVDSDVASGKVYFKSDGTQSTGTGGGGGVTVTDEANTTGTTAVVTADDVTTLITKSITQNGTYTASSDSADGYSSVTVNVSGGSSAQIATGTFTGSGSITQSISCSFAPDLIYLYGDLSSDPSYRGVVSIVIIKDETLIVIRDGSSSASQQSLWNVATNITDYNESNQSGEPYASYSSGTLSFDMVENTSSVRFNSSITYSYKLVKWT